MKCPTIVYQFQINRYMSPTNQSYTEKKKQQKQQQREVIIKHEDEDRYNNNMLLYRFDDCEKCIQRWVLRKQALIIRSCRASGDAQRTGACYLS